MKKLLLILLMVPFALSCSRSYTIPHEMSYNQEVINTHWKVKEPRQTAKQVYIPCKRGGRW